MDKSELLSRLAAVRARLLKEYAKKSSAAVSGLDTSIELVKRDYFALDSSPPQLFNDIFVNAETNARGSGLDAASCSAARSQLSEAFKELLTAS